MFDIATQNKKHKTNTRNAKYDAFIKTKIFIPQGGKECKPHFTESGNYLNKEAIKSLKVVNSTTELSISDFKKMQSYLTN